MLTAYSVYYLLISFYGRHSATMNLYLDSFSIFGHRTSLVYSHSSITCHRANLVTSDTRMAIQSLNHKKNATTQFKFQMP